MKKTLLLAALLAIAGAANSQAAVDAALSGAVTDATTLFGTVKTLILSVIVTFIGFKFLKLVKRT